MKNENKNKRILKGHRCLNCSSDKIWAEQKNIPIKCSKCGGFKIIKE